MEQSYNQPKSEEQLREESIDTVTEFISKTKIYEYFNELYNNGGIEKLDFETFKNLLIRINGLIRKIPSNNRSLDGENVLLDSPYGTALVPNHRDKESILEYAFDSAKSLSREDCSYMIPLLINAVHLFSDGNGRTSRTLHQLLKHHLSKEDFVSELSIALSSEGRYQTSDISPSIIELEIENTVLKEHGWIETTNDKNRKVMVYEKWADIKTIATGQTLDFPDDKKLKMVKKIQNISGSDYKFVLTAFYTSLNDDQMSSIIHTYGYETRPHKRPSPNLMMEHLDESEIEGILNKYYELKKEHAIHLVDIFTKAEEYRSPTDENITLKDYLISEIARKKSL